MAAQSKIEKHKLTERTLALAGEGRTTNEIAQVLTKELGGRDTVSQPTVARFLKGVRQERSEQTKQVVHDHIKATVPADLQALDEIEGFLLSHFRNRGIDLVTGDEATLPNSLKTRIDCGMKAVKIIETKLRFAGILDDPDETVPDIPDLDEFRNDLETIKATASDTDQLAKEGADG